MSERITLSVDYENDGETWWESGGAEHWFSLANGDEEINVPAAVAAAWLLEAAKLPGWADGPAYARNPIFTS